MKKRSIILVIAVTFICCLVITKTEDLHTGVQVFPIWCWVINFAQHPS